MRLLRKLISTDHANHGADIIAEAHGRITKGAFDTASPDGAELVEYF